MPLLVLSLVLAVVLGVFAPRRIALAGTGTVSGGTVLVFIWAVTDGKGDDPAWLLAVAVGVCLAALWIADALGRRTRA